MVVKTKRISTTAGNGASIRPQEHVFIPKPEFGVFSCIIRGTTPYVQHRFSEKARKAILDSQKKIAKQAKPDRDPEADYLAACYVFPGHDAGAKDCKYGIPVTQLKGALVGACRYVDGISMKMASGVVQFLPEEGGLIELHFDTMTMREDGVRIDNGRKFDLRYRPEFGGWWAKVRIQYNTALMSSEQIVNLLATAGFHCGLGEMRPNSKMGVGGSNGLFSVENAK